MALRSTFAPFRPICKEKDDEEVHYALGGLEDKIFVAEYKTKLPSEEEIEEKLKKIEWRDNDQN